jgi:hypothetical protein
MKQQSAALLKAVSRFRLADTAHVAEPVDSEHRAQRLPRMHRAALTSA